MRLVPMIALFPMFALFAISRLGLRGDARLGLIVHKWNGLSDQFLNCCDRLGVVGARHDADRHAGATGAAGAADAVHIIVGVDRHVKVVDMTDLRDIEAAGGDVGSDEQRDFALAELFERGRARGLIHVAVQRLHRKAVP